jgi:hypothetical protein
VFAATELIGRLHAAGAALPERAGFDVRVQYDVREDDTHQRWGQAFVAGRLAETIAGDLPEPDVELHFSSPAAATDVLGNRLDGTDAIASITIVSDEPGGRYVGPPPPIDLPERPELAELPTIRSASAVVQTVLTAGPFGDVDLVQVFVDGRLNTMRLGRLPEPDVNLRVSFRNQALVRAGSMTVLEALETGQVSGSLGSLSLYAGFLESDAFQRAQRACPHRAGVALGTLGEIYATPGYREAVAAIVNAAAPSQ